MDELPDRELEAAKAAAREQYRKTNGQSSSTNSGATATSDDALALEFTARHAADLCYVAPWGHWLQWDGARWKFEDTLAAFDLARAVARTASQACNKASAAAQIASAKTVAAIERLARADRAHARAVEIWDADPWLLPKTMTVELQTGTIRPARREDYFTKAIAVAPRGECPLWHEFLGKITGEDRELQAYLQRVAGYCLTGITSEHVLFFLYGTGANGKGVFLNTLAGIWGDFATVAPMETFVESVGERHPTDLAGLRGARLVVAQETERGRRWAESKIKALTGGDPISARFMRQDFFTFQPQFKLVIAGNHKPSLSSVDEAIRRRFHMIPFTVTIPELERDPKLQEKLRAEWGGILQWAIDGCLEWQRLGLAPPAAVRAATDEYLAEEDGFQRWVEDCCITGRNQWGIGDQLWGSWKAWAECSNERPGARKGFAEAMKTHGFAPDKSQHIRGYAGINLASHDDARDRADLR